MPAKIGFFTVRNGWTCHGENPWMKALKVDDSFYLLLSKSISGPNTRCFLACEVTFCKETVLMRLSTLLSYYTINMDKLPAFSSIGYNSNMRHLWHRVLIFAFLNCKNFFIHLKDSGRFSTDDSRDEWSSRTLSLENHSMQLHRTAGIVVSSWAFRVQSR